MTYNKVLEFWFEELTPQDWFSVSEDIDEQIANNFSQLLISATYGELYEWRKDPLGRLAEIILLDQFSRNIYRGTPQAFAQDAMALTLSQEAISLQIDNSFNSIQKSFLYMPFMHSESLLIHEQAIKLFSGKGLESNLDFELKHKTIIDKFNRYPHRNEVLGRESTDDEIAFLAGPNSSF
jgi:uncharacterized protein (DUF924 family)